MTMPQPSPHSILTIIGKDRIGIVYDVSKLLAEHQINILNISQQLMGEYFTMIILMDLKELHIREYLDYQSVPSPTMQ